MNTQNLLNAANSAIAQGTNITLQIPPKFRTAVAGTGFPKGEFLCENATGGNMYSFDPHKIKQWLFKNGLIQEEK